MARTKSQPVENDEAVEVQNTETDEVTEAPVEAAAEVTEAPAPAEAPAEEYVPADLTGIQALFNQAADAADAAGEELEPEATLQAEINAQYAALPNVRDKAAVRKWVESEMRTRMQAEKFFGSLALMKAKDSAISAKAAKASTPKEPVNPTESYIEDLLAVRLAYTVASLRQPEGLDADWAAKFQERLNELEPQVAAAVEAETVDSAILARAIKLGRTKKSAKGGGGTRVQSYNGPTRSVVRHIEEWAAQAEAGSFAKVSEIANFKSTEYGDDHPSAGAVTGQIVSTAFGERFPNLTAVTENPKGIRVN